MICVLTLTGRAQRTAEAPAEKPIASDAAIQSTFDKTKNETTIEFSMMRIADTRPQTVMLSVAVVFPGEKLQKLPENVFFIFSIATPDGFRFPEAMAMKLTADGKKLPDVVMLNLDQRRLEQDYLETIGTRMSYDVFKKLAQAESVEVQLHDTKFRLTEENTRIFLELSNLLRID